MIREKMNDTLKGLIVVDKVSIRKIYLPKNIQQSIEDKLVMKEQAEKAKYQVKKAEQEALARIEKAKGEAKAEIARAEGIANSNKLIRESIDKTVILWKQLQNQEKEIDKWDGVKPKVMLTDKVTPMIQVEGGK
jgi:regulator of protease activity HflC (stomatin/prohibitin superfamily)